MNTAGPVCTCDHEELMGAPTDSDGRELQYLYEIAGIYSFTKIDYEQKNGSVHWNTTQNSNILLIYIYYYMKPLILVLS